MPLVRAVDENRHLLAWHIDLHEGTLLSREDDGDQRDGQQNSQESSEDAAEYIEGSYVAGAAQLLAMVVSSASLDPSSLLLLAKAVMPNGNSAFLQKPDIPTYLVGNEEALRAFQPLVPAPNETYTSLFWLGDTTEVDNYLLLRKQQEKQAKKTERRK